MTGLLVDGALVVVGVVGLWVGAVWFVRGASRVAQALGVSGLVVGLTVVSFGTSAPEFAVTIDAAVTGAAAISLGNVVGSNVVNLGFVLGGTALVRELPVSTPLVRRDSALMVGAVLALLVALRDLTVSRVEGVVFFLALCVYLVALARGGSEQFETQSDSQSVDVLDPLTAVVGLAVIVAAAHGLVTGTVGLATAVGVSEWAVGVTVVALGTSTPELATSLVAARRGRTNLAAGNVVGSCVFNLLGVLGLATAVRPLTVTSVAVEGTLWLLGVSVVATVLFWSDRALSRAEGGLLVALNALDWLVTLLR